MTEPGQRLLERYPPFMRSDPTLQAVCNAAGPENDAMVTNIDVVANELEPKNASQLLAVWEFALRLTSQPDDTPAQRLNAILTAVQRATVQGTGVDWERLAGLALGSDWSYTVGGVNNSVVTVTVPYSNTSIQGQIARTILQAITPASMEIIINQGAGGFLLDESLLDVGTLS